MILSITDKATIYQLLETYRQLHHWNQDQFLYRNGIPYCAKSTYARMKANHEGHADFHYANLLEAYGFAYHHTSVLSEIQTEVNALHHAICEYQQEHCLLIIKDILKKLVTMSHQIEAVLLSLFFEHLYRYFSSLHYLSEEEIHSYLIMRSLYSNHHALFDIFTFYCIYSASKCSSKLEYQLYLDDHTFYDSTYLPVMVHAMTFDFNHHRYEEGICKGMQVKRQVQKSNNTVMLYEYYDSMMSYYIQCQNEKVEETLELMLELTRDPHFPNNKKLQFENNYVRYSIYQRKFKQALQVVHQYFHDAHIEKRHISLSLLINTALCESQLHLPYSIPFKEHFQREEKTSKADYYFYQYLYMKEDMDKYQQIKYLRNKVIKYLNKETDNFTSYLISLELDLIVMNDSKADLLKMLHF